MTQAPTPRTRAKRLHEKAAYDAASVEAVLDAMPLAHIGHLVDGFPVVTPTLQWREGDRVYWHGSSASRMIRACVRAQVCLTVTLVDGLVLARSGLEHSVNYRCVMVFGVAEAVADAAKPAHLEAMMEGLVPGRWPLLRPMTAQEMRATAVLSLPITEASVKIGAGFPTDPEADMDWPVWAGVVPMRLQMGVAEADPGCLPGLRVPQARFGEVG